MDNLHSPPFYKKYEALLSEPADQRLGALRGLCDQLLESSKQVGYRSTFYRAIGICVIPLILASAAVYVQQGSSWLHAPLFLVALFVVYRRSTLNRLMKSIRKPSTDMSPKQHAAASVNYLRAGLAAKGYRVDTLLMLYSLSFAWVMLLLAVLVYGIESNYTLLIWLTVSYLISAPVWYWFYNRDKQAVSDLDKQAALLETAYYQLPK